MPARRTQSLFEYLETKRSLVERHLGDSVPKAAEPPSTLHEAMRYSLLSGGKRLRPILLIASAEAVSRNKRSVLKNCLPAACAVELIHTSSLIHDDLPCMDNSEMRRHRPSNHRVFGEAVALLAGDALLTRAFGLLATAKPCRAYPMDVLIGEMAASVGSRRLIGGQVADLEAQNRKVTLSEVAFIHERKTAELVVLAVRLGAMLAGASAAQLRAVTDYGRALGLAYQILDDILDLTESTRSLGKATRQDAKAGKATYPAAVGIEASKKEAALITRKALKSVEKLGPAAYRLRQIARRLLTRES